MSRRLENLTPKKVFQYFEDICAIPHGSRNTKAISDYCVAFAKERSLNYIQDDKNNVIIFKDASKGYESHDAVIIQGHLDMVNEKNADALHDFDKDGLDLIIEGDSIHCKDTTLGADDGIAIAYALAILDDDSLAHPPIEAVFTVDEEIGLLGAVALDVTPLQGRNMLNIDSEEEGIFLAGCAGGVTACITLPIHTINIKGISYHLTIKGLNGGHSGTDINKGHANAHKLLGRLLLILQNHDVYFGIQSITGGTKDNVIPSTCCVDLILPDNYENKQLVMELIENLNKELLVEYQVADDNIQLLLEEHNTNETTKETEFEIMSMKTTEILTFFLNHAPNGIQYMNQSISGLVDTSLNMGILYTKDSDIHIGYSIRSSVKSSKKHLMDQLSYITEFLGGECAFESEYPAWSYKQESKLRNIFMETYKEMYHNDAQVQTIHAGLECGIFADKFEQQGKSLDIISFGPNVQNIHTVRESLSISSVERVWNLLVTILSKL